MSSLSSRLRRRLAAERGFTMIVAVGVLLVVMGLSVGAFAAVNGDLRIGSYNSDQKRAYAAAEAGVADYLYHLNQDTSYWATCTGVPAPNAVNQPWNGVGADTRLPANGGRTRVVPGSNAFYAIELLPASGNTCDPANPDTTMIDPSNGTFRIRSTGWAGPTATSAKRSVIATFKRKGFLDFLYYTNLEDQDPVVFSKLNSCSGSTSPPTCYPTASNSSGANSPDYLQSWAGGTNGQCEKYWRDGRGTVSYPGKIDYGSGWVNYPSSLECTEINFVTGDNVDGPFHSNDGILVCGAPSFGRNSNDSIEVSAAAGMTPDQQPWRGNGGCGGNNPDFQGTWSPGSPTLKPPPTNSALKKNATLTYTGATKFLLKSDGTMDVTNDNQTPKTKNIAQPANGVIYVQSSSCAAGYDPYYPVVYDGSALDGCGDVSISGQYKQNLTFGADNDIVVTDDLTHASGDDVLMGLIANNFVRVAHPSTYGSGSGSNPWPDCTNSGSSVNNIVIQAAILALNHSFMVDRYGCGASLGNLNVTGAIAQNHRGTVGTSGGNTGYFKNYTYDDRLKYRSPPKFLDPVEAAWRVAREIEQSPAR